MLDFIFEAIDIFCDIIGELIAAIVDWFDFEEQVIDYFTGLNLRQGRDIPALANADDPKLKGIKELIKNAPTKSVGIFECTYNEDTDEIQNYRAVAADELDERTKSILAAEPLVVLS